MMSAPHAIGIYIASKTKHAERWRYLRDELKLPINSTWIDEAGVGETDDFDDLWIRCLGESSSADLLILYREDGEILKGAMAEIGSALSHGKPVFAVGILDQSIAKHHLVTNCTSLLDAIEKSSKLHGYVPTKDWSVDQIAMITGEVDA